MNDVTAKISEKANTIINIFTTIIDKWLPVKMSTNRAEIAGITTSHIGIKYGRLKHFFLTFFIRVTLLYFSESVDK